MKTIKLKILNAKGHEEKQVGVEEAITLCADQMITGNKWARLINEDGTTSIQTDVTFFSGDISETLQRLENVSEIWMIAALRGGSPLRRNTRAWHKASEASRKGWETRRRREQASTLHHRTEAAFCKAPSKSPFSSLRRPEQVDVNEVGYDHNGDSACSSGGQRITYDVTFATSTSDPVISVKPNVVTVNLLYGQRMIVEALHALCLAIEGPIHNIIKGTLAVRG